MNLFGKKILFICPKFHDYEVMIKSKLEDFGADVFYFPERSYGYDFKFRNNFFPNKMDEFQAKHYMNVLNEVNDIHFDYLFVIRGYKIPKEFLIEFKNSNPKSKSIMYQWDSQRTNPFAHLIPYFDQVKTFDFEDSEKLRLEYIPLFYTDDVIQYITNKENILYDFFFMGFFFEERYEAVLKFRDFCKQNNYTLKSFLYMPFSTKVKYFLKGRRLDTDIVSFVHMARKQYLKILSVSNVMVDVSNPGQTGLAMRVVESLASNTKIITNNTNFFKDKEVAKSGMIELFALSEIKVSKEFMDKKVDAQAKVVLSISEWLKMIFAVYET